MTTHNSYIGTVYLLHFDRPYKHARHYIGWAQDLNARLAEHGTGHGARLLEVVRAAGIGWTLARTWYGTRNRERHLKNRGGASRFCPMCGITPQRDHNVWLTDKDHCAYRIRELGNQFWECTTDHERDRIHTETDILMATDPTDINTLPIYRLRKPANITGAIPW